MNANPKYLSYFWNADKTKSRIKQSKMYQKANDEKSGLHVFGHILFCLIIIVTISSSLRFLESSFISSNSSKYKLLGAEVAMAAVQPDKTELVFQSHTSVNIKPEQGFTFNLSYKNSSANTWTKENVYLKSSTTALKFRHSFWPDAFLPAQLQETEVKPGETGTFKFALQAPTNLGNYSGDFILVDNNVLIKGGNVKVVMNVVEDPSTYTSTNTAINNTKSTNSNTTVAKTTTSTTTTKKSVCTLNLHIAGVSDSINNETCVKQFALSEEGPNVRVGILHTEDAVSVTNNKAWQVYDENDILLASVPANQEMRFNYLPTTKQYVFDFIDRTVRTTTNLFLRNANNGIFTVTSHQDVPSWNKSINYNEFKGDLEVSYYAPKARTWVINKVPLETYLKGLKESSEVNPIEYQKSLIVAARTYALYHVNKFKVEDSFFDLYPDERDQVYKGYVAEKLMKTQSRVVEETSGIVLTHNSEIIIAYYSARSGGQTITAGLPYLASVKTPYSAAIGGLYGHGKGIDQVDAIHRASKDDWTYDQILNYYYRNIDIEKIY
jgi:peptidoglycan hydrolase-like amidase